MPRSLRLAGAVVAIAVTASLAAGCGSSKQSPPASSVTLSRAAFVSSAASGYEVAINVRESLPTFGTLTMTANGTFSPHARAGALMMHMNFPAAAGAGLGNLALQMVFAHGTLYMKVPSQLAGKLPKGQAVAVDRPRTGREGGGHSRSRFARQQHVYAQ